ncbi:MAG: transporter substrate-binding domain-containing protein [Spirochaetaceae bacterium]|jgi:ABC-type amino acid transport substrate-binding protein|nr:transporter substrate-binding domain-containing protein [Spirochaetaceae bacterium]
MKKMPGSLVVFVLVAAGLVLAGCAKKKAGAENERVVEVVTVNTNVPFAFLNDNDEYDGYEIAALREADKRLPQYSFHITGMEFAAMPVALEAGNASIAICMLVRSDARQSRFLFPKEYTTLSPINLVVRKDDPSESLLDLARRKIITIPSGYEHGLLLGWNASHPGEELGFVIMNDATTADTFLAILNGEADASLAYPQGFDIVTKELGITGLRLTQPALIEDTYYMLAKNETQLADDLDNVIREMREDGTLGRISQQYLGEDVFEKYTAQFEAQGAVPQYSGN